MNKINKNSSTENRGDSLYKEKNDVQYFSELTLEDIDTAMLKWLTDINTTIVSANNETKKVPVIFATEERWKQAEKSKGFLDNNRRLILPIIALMRSDISPDLTKRVPANALTNLTISSKPIKQMSNDFLRKYTNPLTKNNENKEVYSVTQIPYPAHFDITYIVKLQDNFISHINAMIENIFSTNSFIVVTSEKGYYFYGFLEKPNQKQIDEINDSERIFTTTFNIKLNAYLIEKDRIEQAKQSIINSETNTRIDFIEKIITNIK